LSRSKAKTDYTKCEVSPGCHQTGGKLWFAGHIFDDGTLEEFTEDCRFDCMDLSDASPRLVEDFDDCYNFDDIDHISDMLSWEFLGKKHSGMAQSTWASMYWDLSTSTVKLGTEKKAKYLQEVQKWQSRAIHLRKDVEPIYSKLLHACHVMPQG
jgi:hypothetical protein